MTLTPEQINKIIHDELIPIQQMFISFEGLAHNPTFHFKPEQFKKCALKTQVLIDEYRNLVSEGGVK